MILVMLKIYSYRINDKKNNNDNDNTTNNNIKITTTIIIIIIITKKYINVGYIGSLYNNVNFIE